MVRGGSCGGASIAGDSKKMVADVDDVVHLVYMLGLLPPSTDPFTAAADSELAGRCLWLKTTPK